MVWTPRLYSRFIALQLYDLDLLLCSKIEPRFIALVVIEPWLNCLGTLCSRPPCLYGSEKSTRLPNVTLEPRGLTGEGLGSRRLQAIVRLGDHSWVADADSHVRLPLCFNRFSCLYAVMLLCCGLYLTLCFADSSWPNLNPAV